MATNGNGNNGIGNGNGERPRLTGLQRAFVDHWFDTRFNGYEAAKRAGYQGDDNTLRSIASENLTKPNIRAEIERRWSAHGVTGEEAIARVAGIMRFDVAQLFDEHGKIQWSKVRQYGHCIKEIEWLPGSKLKVKAYDSQRAAEFLSKLLILEQERGEASGLQVVLDI